jgi:hypothetical protein
MADRYWVGGTGTWDTTSTTNWSASSGGASGASVPTASDSVIFDQSSTYTVTLTDALTCLNFTVSAGTVTFSSTGTLAISGSLSLVSATVWSATGTITFAATSGTNTITTNGVSISAPITFDGVGGTFQLESALTLGSTRTCTLTNGTLNLSVYTLTTGLFSSSNSNTRVLAFGTGKIVLTGASGTVWTNSVGTGFTYTGTSRIEALGPATSGTRTFNPSTASTSTEAIALNFYINGGSGSNIVNFSTTNRRVNILDFTGFTGSFRNSAITAHGNYTLVSGMTLIEAGSETTTTFATTTSQTITTASQTLDFPVTFNGIGGTFVMQDALTLGSTRALTMTNGTLKLKAGTTSTVGSFATSGTNAKYLLSTTFGSQATISDASGTNTVQYLTVQDSISTGGAIFDALAITNVDAGNNTGWLFNTTPSIGTEITMRLRSFTQPRRF